MLMDGVRTGEFIASDFDRNICFDGGWADATQNMQSGLAIALRSTDGSVVPWDAGSADVGTKEFAGILYDHVFADVNEPNKRVGYVARGPIRVTMTAGRIVLAGATTPAEFIAACQAVGIIVRP